MTTEIVKNVTMTTEMHRPALSHDRVLIGAVALADEIGIEDFTIRRLAAALDVKPMTIYHYIVSKEKIDRRDGRCRVRSDRPPAPRHGLAERDP